MDGLHGFWWRRFFSYVPTLRQCTRHRITLVHSLPPWKRNSQMEKKHRNISLEVIGVLMGMSLHREPKLRCCNKTKTKHTSFAPPPGKKCRAKRDHVERKIIFQPTFSGDMLVFWGVSCSWNFWGCDHEPNQRWAGSLDHLWWLYRDLLRVKKSKSLVLEEVFILAIPKAYQIDSDVKLKPKIYTFFLMPYMPPLSGKRSPCKYHSFHCTVCD